MVIMALELADYYFETISPTYYFKDNSQVNSDFFYFFGYYFFDIVMNIKCHLALHLSSHIAECNAL